jgi:hypothetical protein
MKIIEKEDIIETKVKECQKHRLELRELETKYYTLGKQLEEQILAMTKEIEKLNVEKEMLKFDLESLRLNQQNVSFINKFIQSIVFFFLLFRNDRNQVQSMMKSVVLNPNVVNS